MGDRRRILIVDDERELVDMLSMRLEAAGFEVASAYDGFEALRKVREEAPDLIILDVMMPKMDGNHVCRLLKFDDSFRSIPIIMLTARGQDADKILGKEVGADEYITKPFEGKDLIAAIEKHLSR